MLVAWLTLAGCQPRELRTAGFVPGGPPVLCTPGAILPFRVEIDPSASVPVWGLWEADGSRFDITWPSGFTLQQLPELAVVDSEGRVVGRPGQLIDDAGGSGSDPVTICMLDGVEYQLTP